MDTATAALVADETSTLPSIDSLFFPANLSILNVLKLPDDADRNTTSPLDHHLEEYFPRLLHFQNTEEMEKSAIYQEIKEEVERVLTTVVQENFAPLPPPRPLATAPQTEVKFSGAIDKVKALAWNIERGNRFEGIAHALKTHPELKDKDLLLLTELDHGMVRSGNRFVARELAQELKLNYAFVPCYLALQKGSGVEADIEGENTKAIHGLAMFSATR